jgi:hypothetical protein
MSLAPYHLAVQGASLGVFAFAEVEAGLATGRFAGTVLSWREGEVAWVPLAERPEFGAARTAFVTLRPAPTPAFEEGSRWFARGFLRRGALTWRDVLFRPAATFRPFQEGGRIGRAWVWLLLTAFLAAPLLFFLGRSAFGAVLQAIGRVADTRIELAYPLRAFYLLPMWATLLAAVLTLGLQALLRIFAGGAAGWRATFRVIAYLGGAWLLAGGVGFIAGGWALARAGATGGTLGLGLFLGGVVYGILLARGLALAHGDPWWKPGLALVVCLLLGCCGGGLCIAAALVPFFSQLGG